MNHSIHCTGSKPNVERGDCESSLTEEDAISRIADVVAAFIDTNRIRSPLSYMILRNYEDNTRTLLKPFEIAGIGKSEKGQLKELAIAAQKRVANCIDFLGSRVSVNVYRDYKCFVYSKPTVSHLVGGASNISRGGAEDWRVKISAMPVIKDTANGGQNNSRNRLSTELWLKMKSQEALMQPPLKLTPAGEPMTGKDINEFTLSR